MTAYTQNCPECGSAYPTGAVRCERGHVLPRRESEAAIPAKHGLAHNLFSFEGRIGRSTFWLMTLLIFLMSLPAHGILILAAMTRADWFGWALLIWLVSWVPQIWMTLAVWTKRWHDRGKSGKWTLIVLIPFGIGYLWAIIELGFLEGKPRNPRR